MVKNASDQVKIASVLEAKFNSALSQMKASTTPFSKLPEVIALLHTLQYLGIDTSDMHTQLSEAEKDAETKLNLLRSTSPWLMAKSKDTVFKFDFEKHANEHSLDNLIDEIIKHTFNPRLHETLKTAHMREQISNFLYALGYEITDQSKNSSGKKSKDNKQSANLNRNHNNFDKFTTSEKSELIKTITGLFVEIHHSQPKILEKIGSLLKSNPENHTYQAVALLLNAAFYLAESQQQISQESAGRTLPRNIISNLAQQAEAPKSRTDLLATLYKRNSTEMSK